MTDEATLFAEVDPEFEESIRIDRDLNATTEAERRRQRYQEYLDPYYLTDASVNFLEDLLDHIRNDSPEPDERNHWLYGYYGSGKSHLLTALDLLLDTEGIEEDTASRDRSAVWTRFDSADEQPVLGKIWDTMHEEVMIVPLSINLLRYQSVREQTFSEIILQSIYQERGFAGRLDVAFFEEEFKRPGGLYDTRPYWEDRQRHLNEILAEEGVANPEYTWDHVREYRILSDIVLEGLTERATGMTANLEDIQSRNVGQELAVQKIESYRQQLEEEHDRPVKIVLLMDEVTLFIGGNYQRLSELNALAESISDIGQGNIISVVTAQSQIEDVQPGLATKQLDFGILKDRFPQQYELPSQHVGEIVQQRLLAKSPQGTEWVRDEALTGSVHPDTMLVYSEVGQNTEPPLDTIADDRFIEYYPLLPYQPALFMEILSNLRNELADATKSIFSGTARAILSLVAGLREDWTEKDSRKPVISLVDFYDLVQYELKDIIPDKTEVIEDINSDPETDPFDVRVAKAVLLLSYVPNMVPQTDANLAVAVMDDLEGKPRSNIQNKVRQALEGNLEKYIREDTSTDGSKLRLTDSEEQDYITRSRNLEADPDWDSIIAELDDSLWADAILPELSLPESHRYTDDGEEDEATAYSVGYEYVIDGQSLDASDTEDAVFEVDIVIRGLRPDSTDDSIDQETLYWMLDDEGINDLRSQLVEWWALKTATAKHNPPESIVRDLDDATNRVREKLVAALRNGYQRVEASEFTSVSAALDDYIDEAYPPYWHPLLSEIDESHLRELRELEDGSENPDWATKIDVPPASVSGIGALGDIAVQVRSLVGKEVQNSTGDVDLATILDRAVEEEPIFGIDAGDGTDPSPATLAVLWGLCRADFFRLKRLSGEPAPLDAIFSPDQHTSLTVTPVVGSNPKEIFVEHDIIEPTATGNRGYVEFDALLERIERRATSLAEDAQVQSQTTFQTDAISTLIENLATTATDIADVAAGNRGEAIEADVDDLEEMVETTVENQELLETAEDRWESRKAYLLQLEGLARLPVSEIEWLSEAGPAYNTLITQLEDTGGIEWWTDSGWPTFVDSVDARTDVIDALRSAWDTQQRATDVESLQSDLEGHSWLIDPRELPVDSVHEEFRMEYLDSLRGFRRTVEQIQTAIEPLTMWEPTKDEESTLTHALGVIDNLDAWNQLTATTIDNHRTRLQTLDRLVGDATPDDLQGIGVLHDDADVLQSQIENLDIDDHTPEVIEVEDGVIIR